MIWQDWAFTLGSLILTLGILPMVWHKHKPPLSASVPVFVVLYGFSATYVTLGFVAAPIIETTQATLWLVLAWQRYWELQKDRWADELAAALTPEQRSEAITILSKSHRKIGTSGHEQGRHV